MLNWNTALQTEGITVYIKSALKNGKSDILFCTKLKDEFTNKALLVELLLSSLPIHKILHYKRYTKQT